MKLFTGVIILGLFGIVGCSSAPTTDGRNCAHDRTTIRCVRYLSNYDGETIRVDIPDAHPVFGENVLVRIAGIDTPDVRSPSSCERTKATRAKDVMRNTLAQAKQIDLVNVRRDRYFRIVADVVADGVNVKHKLLDEQLAYTYHGGTKPYIDWCEDAPISY